MWMNYFSKYKLLIADLFGFICLTLMEQNQIQGNLYTRVNDETITSVPSDIPQNTTHLNLEGNKISMINVGDLQHLTSLQSLRLSNNDIAIIADGGFGGLPLKFLNATKNSLITMVNIDDIKNTLININLQYNQINYTDDGTFNNMPLLNYLNLGNNHLHNLTLGNLPVLRTVDLRENMLTQMPILLNELPELLILQLDYNEINSAVPGYFTKTPNLKELHLHSNQLTSLDAFYLTNLTLIKLQFNALETFPNITSCVETLENLQIDGNPIHNMELSLIFGNGDPHVLNNLERLYLSGNNLFGQFKSLINTMLSMSPNLEILYLLSTNMTSFPDISQLTR